MTNRESTMNPSKVVSIADFTAPDHGAEVSAAHPRLRRHQHPPAHSS
jgi:hypothetical protein